MGSYLRDQVKMVIINGARSKPKRIVHGVPQGSVLGVHTLFLAMIDDLHYGSALQFVDDTRLIARDIDSVESVLYTELYVER